jgi:hypothetical protein
MRAISLRYWLAVLLVLLAPSLALAASCSNDCARLCGAKLACLNTCRAEAARTCAIAPPSPRTGDAQPTHWGSGHSEVIHHSTHSASRPAETARPNIVEPTQASKPAPPHAPTLSGASAGPPAANSPSNPAPTASGSSNPAAAKPAVVDTAYAPLYKLGGEAPGYGLYSYVIFRGPGDRERRLIKTILHSTPDRPGLQSLTDAQINLLFVPTNSSAAAPGNNLPVDSRVGCLGKLLADLSAYDFDFARSLLDRLCAQPAEGMASFCSSGYGKGPFLFTYVHPVSGLGNLSLPPPFLFVDLSTVEPAAFAEYVDAYKAQVKSEDISDRSKIDTIRLRVLKVITAAASLLNPIDTAMANILHAPGADSDK